MDAFVFLPVLPLSGCSKDEPATDNTAGIPADTDTDTGPTVVDKWVIGYFTEWGV